MKNIKTSTLAILGAKWISISIVFQKIIQAIVIIIIARLLVPEDFGLVAIAMLTLNTINRIKDFGMRNALIRQKDNLREAANVLFFFNIIFSILIYAIIFASTSAIAAFFNNAAAAPVLKVMMLLLIIEAASTVQQTLAIREMAFKKQALITLCNSTMTSLVSVVLAARGFGVWSLVYGPLVGSLIASFLWGIFSQWRPTLHFNRKTTAEMLGLGIRLFGASSIDRILIAVNRIFIGRFLGVISLGFYDLTSRIIYLPYYNIILIGQRVALPAFCQIQEDTEQIKRWYLKMINYSCLVMAPVSITFFFLPDYFIPVIYGEKWLPIAPLVRVLAIYSFMMPLMYSFPVYVATKRADILLKFSVVRLLIAIPLLFFTAQISLFAVCFAELIIIMLFAPVNLFLIKKLIQISGIQIAYFIKMILPASIVFTVVLLLLRQISTYYFNKPNLFTLAAIILPALGSYLLMIYKCHPEVFVEIKNMISISIDQKRD